VRVITMKFLRQFILVFVAVVAGPAFAVNGYHSGLHCHATAVEAAQERCAGMLWPSGITTAGSGAVSFYQCNRVMSWSPPSCPSSPTAGSFCSVTFEIGSPAYGSSQQSISIPVCDLDLASQAGSRGGAGGGGSSSGVTGTVTFVAPSGPEADAAAASRIADMALLWGLFLGAAIVIVIARKFLNLWESSPHVES
jgi:hypothetical protein